MAFTLRLRFVYLRNKYRKAFCLNALHRHRSILFTLFILPILLGKMGGLKQLNLQTSSLPTTINENGMNNNTSKFSRLAMHLIVHSNKGRKYCSLPRNGCAMFSSQNLFALIPKAVDTYLLFISGSLFAKKADCLCAPHKPLHGQT